MKTTTKYILITLAGCASITLGAQAVNAQSASAPSPIKAFQDLPEGYADIIAGCIGTTGWYTNNRSNQLQVIAADPNCKPGGALNRGA